MNRIKKVGAAFAFVTGTAATCQACLGAYDRAAEVGLAGIAVASVGTAVSFRRSAQKSAKKTSLLEGLLARQNSQHAEKIQAMEEYIAAQGDALTSVQERNTALETVNGILQREGKWLKHEEAGLRQNNARLNVEVLSREKEVARLEMDALADAVLMDDLRHQLAVERKPFTGAFRHSPAVRRTQGKN